jgi:pimeloyl-ACP methyl ester carboxylesterase
VVYAGFSLGALPAQELAQTRPGAAEALLFEACAPVAQFGRRWPPGVPVQVGWMATTRSLGKGPRSLSSYDAAAAALLNQRVILFLESVSLANSEQ